jgi:hypothetical protein
METPRSSRSGSIDTRAKVRILLDEGLSQAEIASSLGLVKSTVAYHVRRLRLTPDERFNRRYDWAEIQRFYDAGHSITECQGRFGFARMTAVAEVRRGDLVTRPHGMPIERLLAAPRNRSHLKARLMAVGLLGDTCEGCGIKTWRERPLSLALHHRNGQRDDNRLENLEVLCPNCHSQTERGARLIVDRGLGPGEGGPPPEEREARRSDPLPAQAASCSTQSRYSRA